MDFGWSDEELRCRDAAFEFAKRELGDDIVDRDRSSRFSRELWRRAARFGIQSLLLPPEYSGRKDQRDILTAVLIMEGLGRGSPDTGLCFALSAQVFTVALPILRFGTEEQRRRFLPGLASGDLIGAHALSEPGAGSDAFALETVARRVPGGYRLEGRKRFVTLGPVADLALVFATVDPARGKWGVTAFVVERAKDHFRAGENQEKMGLRTVPFGDLHFEGALVPEENRLGPEGAGVSISTESLEYERCAILASQLGTMERQLERAIEHARARRQFGEPIGRFQSVANRIADMRLRLEAARLLLYKVAWLKRQGRSAMLEAALLKLHLSESFVESSLDAVRTHGGVGYLSEEGIERDLRDAVGGLIYAGTSDMQRRTIARLLGL